MVLPAAATCPASPASARLLQPRQLCPPCLGLVPRTGRRRLRKSGIQTGGSPLRPETRVRSVAGSCRAPEVRRPASGRALAVARDPGRRLLPQTALAGDTPATPVLLCCYFRTRFRSRRLILLSRLSLRNALAPGHTPMPTRRRRRPRPGTPRARRRSPRHPPRLPLSTCQASPFPAGRRVARA